MIHAFLADSRLYVRGEQGEINEIESTFAKQKIEEADRRDSRQQWKRSGEDESNPYSSAHLVWGRQAMQRHTTFFRFQHVLTVDPHNLYYVLSNDVVTGLFKYNISDKYEQRLFHRNGMAFHGIDFSTQLDQFVAGVQGPDGRVDLTVLNSEGAHVDTITGGDSCDAYPSFGKSDGHKVFFQSSGIARDEEGRMLALGPASVNSLDTRTGELRELLSDEDYDYLLPRQDSQGRIYSIRRPYHRYWQRTHLGMVRDALLFPFRFLSAVLGFLKAFTHMFESSNMRKLGPEMQSSMKGKYLRVLGTTIDVAKIKKASGGKEGLSLVPGSWELIRMGKNGETTVIGRNVCSYDIDAQDNVVFTNGFRVRRMDNSSTQDVFEHNLIGDIRIAR